MILLINFLFSFFLAFIFLTILKKLSLRFSVFKSKENIPLLGGVGIALSILLIFLLYHFRYNISFSHELINIFIFAYAILIIELFDDWHEFSLSKKVLIQIIIIALFLMNGKRVQIYFLSNWINYLISFLWIMGITNAFNHLDIKDSLCGGICLIISLFFSGASFLCGNYLLANLFLILSGALAAFCLFNLPPAKMYMGNSGSHFVGFLFASLSISLDYASLENAPALFTPLIILAFPIIDTFFLIFARLRKGLLPFKKSNDHISLRLISKGYSHKIILAMVYFVVLAWCGTGIFLLLGRLKIFGGFFVLAVLFTSYLIYKAAKN